METGHGFSVEDNGEKRQAFVGELTQPQMEFLFAAKEQRKKMRRESGGGGSSPGSTTTKNTTHIT